MVKKNKQFYYLINKLSIKHKDNDSCILNPDMN